MSDDASDVPTNDSVDEVHATIIACEPTVDITVVDTLYQHLNKAFEEGHEVEIDAGEVSRIDAAVLQLLCAFFRDAANAQLTVRWKRVSDAVTSAAELLGIRDQLKLSAVSQ